MRSADDEVGVGTPVEPPDSGNAATSSGIRGNAGPENLLLSFIELQIHQQIENLQPSRHGSAIQHGMIRGVNQARRIFPGIHPRPFIASPPQRLAQSVIR